MLGLFLLKLSEEDLLLANEEDEVQPSFQGRASECLSLDFPHPINRDIDKNVFYV